MAHHLTNEELAQLSTPLKPEPESQRSPINPDHSGLVDQFWKFAAADSALSAIGERITYIRREINKMIGMDMGFVSFYQADGKKLILMEGEMDLTTDPESLRFLAQELKSAHFERERLLKLNVKAFNKLQNTES